MKNILLYLIIALPIVSCSAQNSHEKAKLVGGPCEGCEAIYEFGNKSLKAIDTLPGYLTNSPKILLTGTVYEVTEKKPVSDVILYIYHTNREGLYKADKDEQGWGKRHGPIRGWVKTDKSGNYSFYTFRPSAYPGGREPEHIHITVKEPDKNEYYIDEFVFDDDPLLTIDERQELTQRGGSGVIKLKMKNGILIGHRDIFLGKNIPDYE